MSVLLKLIATYFMDSNKDGIFVSMKLLGIIVTFSLLACQVLLAQESFKTIKAVDNKVSMSVPESFRPMTTEEMSQRLLSAKPPRLSLTDRYAAIDFTLTVAPTMWDARDLHLMKEFYKSTFYAVYDDIQMDEEALVTIKDRSFLIFKMSTMVAGENLKKPIYKYSYLAYTIIGNQLFIFNFSCPQSEKNRWVDTAEQIMQSIKIK
jgi:hypothetical protein